MKVDVVILGGGAAGISTAYGLKDSSLNFVVLEKNKYIGGLATTLKFGDFLTDVGPHRFFSKNRELYKIIEQLLGEDWIKVDRLTRFYIKGKLFLYPISIVDVLKNLGFKDGVKIAMSYGFQRLRNFVVREDPKNFEDVAVRTFGRALAELNMLNYTEKIWGLKPFEVSKDWFNQRIKNISIGEIIKKAIFNKSKAKTLQDVFYYPKYGTKMIYESMAKEITLQKGDVIKMQSYPTKIIVNGNTIKEVHAMIKEKKEIFKPTYVVSTIPLHTLLSIMDPQPPANVIDALKSIRYRSHVGLFITLNRDKVMPDQWMYFPEKHIPFARIMEPKNFSKALAPKGKTSLFIEFFCWYGDEIWNSSEKQLLKISYPYLKDIFGIKKEEIMDVYVHKERFAYPVYDVNYSKHINTIKSFLDTIENLYYIGRTGRFFYNNQDCSIEAGLITAKAILNNIKPDYDSLCNDDEYLEEGGIEHDR